MKKRFAIFMLSAVMSLLAGYSKSTATNETVSSYSETEIDSSQPAVTTTTTITTEPAVTTDTTSSGSDSATDTEPQVQKSRLDNCKYSKINKDRTTAFKQNEKFGVFSATSSSKYAFYHFSDNGIVGIAPDDVKLMFDDNDDRFSNRINVKYLEMYFGLKANIKDNILEVNKYDNTNRVRFCVLCFFLKKRQEYIDTSSSCEQLKEIIDDFKSADFVLSAKEYNNALEQSENTCPIYGKRTGWGRKVSLNKNTAGRVVSPCRGLV